MPEQPKPKVKVFINHHLDRKSFPLEPQDCDSFRLSDEVKEKIKANLIEEFPDVYERYADPEKIDLPSQSVESIEFGVIFEDALSKKATEEYENFIQEKISEYIEGISSFKRQLRDYGVEVADFHEIEVFPGLHKKIEIEKLANSADIFISILLYEQLLLIEKNMEDTAPWEYEEAFTPFTDEYYKHSLSTRQSKIHSSYIVPVIITDDSPSRLDVSFPLLKELTPVRLKRINELGHESFIQKIIDGYNRFEENKATSKAEKEQKKRVIEKSAPEFIQDTLERLQSNENRYRTTANRWNLAGFISLILGAGLLFYFGIIKNPTTSPNWQVIIFSSVKAALVVVVLVAVAKYTFDLAKSNMNEALKNSDRIHAIEFGKFYLEVFGGEIDSKEMKEVFQNWNLQQDSSFLKLDPDKFDPKVFENINQLLAALSNFKAENGVRKVKKKDSNKG